MAAFSAFFMQSPSFLAHQRHLSAGEGRSNCQTLFAMDRIPGDSQIRAMLDPVEPAQFHLAFADALAELEQTGVIDKLRVLNGHVLIALDGSEYYCSTKHHCVNCSTRNVATARWSSPPCWPRRWSAPATTPRYHWNRSLLSLRTVMRSRTARAGRCGAGWWRMPLAMRASSRCILATTCSRASQPVRPTRCGRAFHLRLQAHFTPDDRGIPRRHRA